MLDKAKRFQALDGKPGVDETIESKDEVMVARGSNAHLPQSTGNKLAHLAVGILAPKEKTEEVSGYSRAESGKVVTADLTTHEDGKETDFQYTKQKDGTEIFHGPTADGFAVVVENKKTGLLMMKTSEGPLRGSFNAAERGDIQVENPLKSGSSEPSQPTFAETLKALASGEQASGIGTIAGDPSGLGKLAGDTKGPGAMAGDSDKIGYTEPVDNKSVGGGFFTAFGGTASETFETAKINGEQLLGDVTDGVKDAGKKIDETAKETVQSVKDWTQTDTAETVGKLLFGKLNPFGRKK